MQQTKSEVHVTKLRSKRCPVTGASDAAAAADYQLLRCAAQTQMGGLGSKPETLDASQGTSTECHSRNQASRQAELHAAKFSTMTHINSTRHPTMTPFQNGILQKYSAAAPEL
jgi:hypothetical protein